MVSTASLALLMATAIAAVSGAPAVSGSAVIATGSVQERSSEIAKRANVKLEVYEAINYGGSGLTLNLTNDVCFNLSGAWSGWNNIISSAKTPTNGFACYIYDSFDCTGDRGGPITTANPHPDLHKHGWGDRVSSIKCI